MLSIQIWYEYYLIAQTADPFKYEIADQLCKL